MFSKLQQAGKMLIPFIQLSTQVFSISRESYRRFQLELSPLLLDGLQQNQSAKQARANAYIREKKGWKKLRQRLLFVGVGKKRVMQLQLAAVAHLLKVRVVKVVRAELPPRAGKAFSTDRLAVRLTAKPPTPVVRSCNAY
jgi:hypothetical protein